MRAQRGIALDLFCSVFERTGSASTIVDTSGRQQWSNSAIVHGLQHVVFKAAWSYQSLLQAIHERFRQYVGKHLLLYCNVRQMGGSV